MQFLRTASGYSRWMRAVVGFVKWCQWTQLSVLSARSSTFKSTVQALSDELSLAKLSVIASMSFDEDDDDRRSLLSQLQGIEDRHSSKVVVAMALESTYLKIALAAHEMGMLSGWAWLGLDTVPLAANYAPEKDRAKVDLLFSGWIYFEPHFAADRDFFDRVHNATRSDFPTLFDESVFPNPYAAAMYDATILFAIVANQQRWRPEQGGRAFLNQSSGNLSFQGATGLVQLDANGDSLLSYQAVNLVLKNGALQRIAVGVSTAGTQSYSSNGIPIIWPGGLLSVPADAAVADGFDTTWILVGAGVSAVAVVAGVTILVRKRHAHLQAIMLQLFTEVFPVSPSISAETPVVIPIRPAASPVCSLVTRPRALPPS
jgi:hypothetical protein